MQKYFGSFIAAAVAGYLLLGAAMTASAADASGKWAWTTQGRQGGQGQKVTLTLKADGEKLTGTLSSPGRNDQVTKTEIADGKVKGDEVSFTVTREFNGNKMVTKYDGTVSGNELKMKITRDTQNGPQTNEVTAKKATT